METNLKRFGIFHPKGGHLNIACELDKYTYEHIGSIQAENLVRSFYMAQNDFNPEYAQLKVRSASVGDIITDDGQVYMIMGNGYKRINSKHRLHRKISTIDAIAKLNEVKLSQEDVDELLDNCV